MDSPVEHWNEVYATRAVDDVSWYQDNPATSVRLLKAFSAPSDPIVDVGAGASTLVDVLVRDGWRDITVLDVSGTALDLVRHRIGPTNDVTFARGDIRHWEPGRSFRAWHDRAVFHFMVDDHDRQDYVELVRRAVEPGGVVVVATFALDGPATCSGLATARYDAHGLARAFGELFRLEHSEREEHVTPWGAVQPFTWVVLRQLTAVDQA